MDSTLIAAAREITVSPQWNLLRNVTHDGMLRAIVAKSFPPGPAQAAIAAGATGADLREALDHV